MLGNDFCRSIGNSGVIRTAIPFLARYAVSVLFFYFFLVKIIMVSQNGLNPYLQQMKMLGLPGILGYHIMVAMAIELFLASGIWYKITFKIGLILGFILVGLGIVMSIASLIFRFNSDCGSGLLGKNEYGLIIQKTAIISLMILVYKSKWKYFAGSENKFVGA